MKEDIKKISLWVALAAVLQVSESLIPHPIPGLRFGFANMVTLIVMANYGYSAAFKVTLLRVLISSFVMGTFMSPAFILSFSGALAGVLAMGIFYRISVGNSRFYFSLLGISVAGAFFHNITQLVLAYFLLVRHRAIFIMLPWLSAGAVIMGVITGMIALKVTRRLQEPGKVRVWFESRRSGEPFFEAGNFTPGNSILHRLRPEVKVIGVIVLAIAVFFTGNIPVHLFLIAGAVMVALLCGIPPVKIIKGVGRMSFLIFASFLFPVIFGAEGGMFTGSLLGLRIVFLVITALLLVQTTSPEGLTLGLKRILAPLKVFGINTDETAETIELSWKWIPELWGEIRGMFRFLRVNRVRRMRALFTALTDFFVFLFQKEMR